ncbi:MAG: Mu transposase C-terminal domain-containing protein, partial [Anaerolineae bacterium]
VEQACLSMGDLDRLLHLFIVDRYAMDRHAGLGGDTPAGRWAALTADPFAFAPYVPASAEDLKVLLGRVTMRTVQRYGIEFETLRYNGDALSALRDRQKPGEKVKVKYHPGDLSRIYVFDQVGARYLEVPALARDYTRGLSLWKHQLIRERALAEQGRVDLVGLGRAKQAMCQIVEQAWERKRTNARLARWTTGGAPFRDLGPPAPAVEASPGGTSRGKATPSPSPTVPATADEAAAALEALLAALTPEAPGWQLSFRPREEDEP